MMPSGCSCSILPRNTRTSTPQSRALKSCGVVVRRRTSHLCLRKRVLRRVFRWNSWVRFLDFKGRSPLPGTEQYFTLFTLSEFVSVMSIQLLVPAIVKSLSWNAERTVVRGPSLKCGWRCDPGQSRGRPTILGSDSQNPKVIYAA